MSSLMHLDCARDEEVELYCDEALDSFSSRSAFPSLPRSSSATDLYHPTLCASPLPRSASTEPLHPLSRGATPCLESPARKRASPGPSSSPLHHLHAALPPILADDDISFLLSSESNVLQPLLSFLPRRDHELPLARPPIVSNIFSVAAAYHADSCIPFQALSLLDRVIAQHSFCTEPPTSHASPFVSSSSSSASPPSSATTPVLFRGSPLSLQQHTNPRRNSPHSLTPPRSSQSWSSSSSSSSSSSFSSSSSAAARCSTPLTMLSNDFSNIAVNSRVSPLPASSPTHSPRGFPHVSSSHDEPRPLLSRKRPAALVGSLFASCQCPAASRPLLPCAICSLAAHPCAVFSIPIIMQSLSAAALLISFKFMVDGPVPSAREYAALFGISAEQLKLAEMAVLRAVDWRVRAPTVGDFLQLLAERERSADTLPLHLLQQLHQHAEQYTIRFMNHPDSSRFLPSEIAAAAWRESLSLWGMHGGCSADIAAALIVRRSTLAPILAASMAAAKSAVVFELQASQAAAPASALQNSAQFYST